MAVRSFSGHSLNGGNENEVSWQATVSILILLSSKAAWRDQMKVLYLHSLPGFGLVIPNEKANPESVS